SPTRGRRDCAPALLTDIAESESETRLAIAFLLGDDPVEADHAVAQTVQSSPPKFEAEALPAMLRLDDIEAQESEARAVANGGDAANRNAVAFADKEALWIGGVKAVRVMKTGIPALRRGPFEGEREIGLRHVAHNESCRARVLL